MSVITAPLVSQELVAARDPPNFYLDKLKARMTMKGSKVSLRCWAIRRVIDALRSPTSASQ